MWEAKCIIVKIESSLMVSHNFLTEGKWGSKKKEKKKKMALLVIPYFICMPNSVFSLQGLEHSKNPLKVRTVRFG